MKKYVGLWIDHKQAVIVSLIDGAESITHLKSNIEGHFRLSGGFRSSTPYGSKSVAPEKKKVFKLWARRLRNWAIPSSL
jgi:hypothetical protein